MRRLCALLAIGFLACGPDVRFDGRWRGTWAASMSDGTIQGGDIRVESIAGDVTGNGTNTKLASSFTVIGTVDRGGRADMTYTYPGVMTLNAVGDVRVVSGHGTGTFDLFIGRDRVGTSTVDLATY